MLKAALLFAAGAAAAAVNAPVQKLDVPRYMGTWHEIARLPQKFQQQCVADVTATYRLKANGRIEVTNACRTKAGSRDVAVGEAKATPRAQGALKVRFAPAWLAAIGIGWGDYWIIELESDYRWVMIGSPSKDYLWILSRTPELPADVLAGLKARAAARGYDVQKLIVSAQTS